MADRLRIVNLRWPRPPAVLADLASTGTSRDSFAITPGDPGANMSASTTRWGGARVTSERRGNSTLAVTMLVSNQVAATPKAAIGVVQNALENALTANMPDLAIEWDPDGGPYSEFWRIVGPATYKMNYSWAQFASANLLMVEVSFPVTPLAEGAPYDISDDFSSDTITSGDWIKDGGTASVSVAGGALVPSAIIGANQEMRYRHARGYQYGDVEVGMRFTTGSTLTNGRWMVTLGADGGGADNELALVLTPTGYSLWGYVPGSGPVTLSGPTAITVTANTTYYLQLRRAGNVAYWRVTTSLNYNEWSVEPNSLALTGSFLRWTAAGNVGWRWSAADVAERADEFYARPYTYKGIQSPEHIQLLGTIVGDAPALADVEVMPIVGASTAPAIFGMVAWCERPQIQNLCYGGNLTTIRSGGSNTYGWSVGAVSGVIAAASSYSRAAGTTPKYGSNALEVVCPATTDTGATFLITRRFKKGKLYAAWGWMAAASGTTQARIKLGVSGDLSTENPQNLSATLKLHAVTWQPTADRDSAYVAFGIANATATTFDASGVNVVEAPMVTIGSGGITSGATTMPVWITPSDIPGLNPDGSLSQPFLALIDQEFVLVTAISGQIWTISRGAEGTTAASHSQDAPVVCAPPSRQQFEGKGAQAPFGILEGEMFAADRSSATATTGNSDYRAGGYATFTASTAQLDYYVDPSAIPPDDFSQGDVLVEVWARVALDPAGTGVVLSASAIASETYDPDTALASLAGVARYTLEYGSAGIAPPAPTGTGGTLIPQFVRLGTLPMVSDRSRPQRWKIRVTPTYTGGVAPRIDYLQVMPIRGRVATQTGKASADPTYASFVPPVVSANAVAKILRSDGSALLRVPRIGAYTPPESFPDAGLGHGIEFPPTDIDIMVKLSNLVPNDPGSQPTEMFSTQPYWSNGLHVAVTPRFATARGS